jgi:hypothetical protein
VDEDEIVEVLEQPGEDRAGRAGSRIALGQTASGRYLSVIYVPDDNPRECIRDHGLRPDRETPGGVPPAQKKEKSMSHNKFPDGWDEERVQQVLAYYEQQTEDDALAEDEAGVAPSETVMSVPRDLVPKVRELIAKHRG